MTTQQRPAAGTSGRQPVERSVFSAQLWKAVGLQPRQLSIPRTHFFPDEPAGTWACPSMPSSSRGSDDLRHGGLCRNVQAQQGQLSESHKRRRSSAMRSPQRQQNQQQGNVQHDLPSCSHAWSGAAAWAPDLNAIMHAPRRPRTLASRRRLRNLHQLAAEFSFPSQEPLPWEASPATSGMQQEQPSSALQGPSRPSPASCQPWGVLSQQQQPLPSRQQPLSVCQASSGDDSQQQQHDHSGGLGSLRKTPHHTVAALQPDLLGTCFQQVGEVEKRHSTKGSPASHSAESSLGVFADLQEAEVRADADGDLASPGSLTIHHAKQQQSHRAAWCRSSPLSSDDAF